METKVEEFLQNYAIALDKYGSLSEKEVEDFEQYSNRAEAVLSSSLDYIVLLKGRLNTFTSYPGTRSVHITSNNNVEQEGAQGVKKMELPTLPIPTFYGDLWELDNFWTLFDANVNSKPLPEPFKFNYLIKAPKGKPLQAI
ncbi:unnamed protein product [Cylicostephanus goldi]|uniref:Uncharacterized protein n=1 Tax=Cylicostephanus goldi TaxID=71465 RepID=A0A3P7N4G6_CYLGO|nr:unnamed protein product [Cylicostephanus goldi]